VDFVRQIARLPPPRPRCRASAQEQRRHSRAATQPGLLGIDVAARGARRGGRPRSRCWPPGGSSTAAPARPWRSWGPSSGRRRNRAPALRGSRSTLLVHGPQRPRRDIPEHQVVTHEFAGAPPAARSAFDSARLRRRINCGLTPIRPFWSSLSIRTRGARADHATLLHTCPSGPTAHPLSAPAARRPARRGRRPRRRLLHGWPAAVVPGAGHPPGAHTGTEHD